MAEVLRVSVVKVLTPVIAILPLLIVQENVLYVKPPPWNVKKFVGFILSIVDVPAFNVMPAEFCMFQVVVLALKFHVVAPNVSDRVLELDDEKVTPDVAPTAWPFVFKLPLVSVIVEPETGS